MPDGRALSSDLKQARMPVGPAAGGSSGARPMVPAPRSVSGTEDPIPPVDAAVVGFARWDSHRDLDGSDIAAFDVMMLTL